MLVIPSNRFRRNPEFTIRGMPAKMSLKERLRYGRYLDLGYRETAKIANPIIGGYFFLLYCDALHSENQIIDLTALRKRAAELAAEDANEPDEPEVAPSASHDRPPSKHNQHRPRAPPAGRGTSSNERAGR
jgi:hypothetical protein